MRFEGGKYIAEYGGKDIGKYNTAAEAQAAEKDAAAADANKGSSKLKNAFNKAGDNGDSIDDLINKHYNSTNGTWDALLKVLRANGADDKTIAGIIKSKGLNGAKAQEWLKNYESNNPKSGTPTAPSTGNMVDGWYSWIDPYNGKAQYNKLSGADATATRKQMAEQYPGYNIQWEYHKNENEAKKAAAGKKGEPAKPKKEIQVPPKNDDNGSGTSGTGAKPQAQTEELDKFFASLTYTDKKSFDEALNKVDDKIKELQAQVSTLKGQSKEIANATLNELMKRKDDYIAEAEKSTDLGIKERAKQAKDAHISPEQGNEDKQKVAQKFANGEELTAEEWATLDANRTDIAAMVTDIKGGDYKAIQDEINKKVYDEFKKNAQKGVDDLANSESEIDPKLPEGKGTDTTNPPETGKTDSTTGTGGKDDGEGETDLDKFWKAFRAGAFRAYPMLQAIGDALSQQAKMTMDRANILTGQGSDLSVYEGKDPSEYFFNEDYEYRQAFLDAENGNYEGVKELLLKGKVTLEQVAAALKLTEEDVEKIFGQEIRRREADTVSKELANEKVLKDEIKDLHAQLTSVNECIRDLEGSDRDYYLDVLAKFMSIYEGRETVSAQNGTTTTENDSSGGNLGGNAGNSVVGLNASINGAHGESTTESRNASRNKDISAIKALPKGEEYAQMALEDRDKANNELMNNLLALKQKLLDQIAEAELQLKTIRTNQNAAQTGGKNTIVIPSSKDMPTTPTTTPTDTPTDTTTTTDASGGNGNATEQQ